MDDFRLQLRAGVIFLATFTAIAWTLFSLGEYPWVVPADSIWSRADASQRAALAGAAMFVLSLATVNLVAGLFGCGRGVRIAGCVILLLMVAATTWLYPSTPVWEFPRRLCLHSASLMIAAAGMFLVNRKRSRQSLK